jgi:transcription initiation factor TFIID subunit 11
MSDETSHRQANVATLYPKPESSFPHSKSDPVVKQEAELRGVDSSPTALAKPEESFKQRQNDGVTNNSLKNELEEAPELSKDSEALLPVESRVSIVEGIAGNGNVAESKVDLPAKEEHGVVKSSPGFATVQGKRKRSLLDHADDGELEHVRKAQRCDSAGPDDMSKDVIRCSTAETLDANASQKQNADLKIPAAPKNQRETEGLEPPDGPQRPELADKDSQRFGDKNEIDGDEGAEEEEEDIEMDVNAMRRHEYEQVARFGPNQLHRYEQYRRSDLKKDKFKRVLAAINPMFAKIASSDPFLIAVKGLTKLFVGDVVEAALDVRKDCGDTGPLQPKHLREAYRRLRREGCVPSAKARPSLF